MKITISNVALYNYVINFELTNSEEVCQSLRRCLDPEVMSMGELSSLLICHVVAWAEERCVHVHFPHAITPTPASPINS